MKWEKYDMVENQESDYGLMTEEAIDELIGSCEFDQMAKESWLPINDKWVYSEGFWDSVKSGWNKITGKNQQQPAKTSSRRKTTARKPATKNTPAKKTASKKPVAKKATAAKKPATKKTATTSKKPTAKKPASGKTVQKKPTQKKPEQKTQNGGKKTGGIAKKAIEMGKKQIQKKIGGPSGVEKYVKENQKNIDGKLQKAPSGVKGAWESIKAVVALGSKKTLEFCKKHWKAIVIVICVIIAIILLIKYFRGSGTETVTNSNIAQNSINEVNNGAKDLTSAAASGGKDLMDNYGNREWFNSMDSKKEAVLGKMFKDDPEMIANNDCACFNWGGDTGIMSKHFDGTFAVNMEGQVQMFDKMGNPLDCDGNILDMKEEMEHLANSDPKFGVLKAKLFANACHAMKHAMKIGAAQLLP